ncbi:MAG: fimbrial protein, partial [Pantoea sp.]|uniref:fimbrial protein n=1 Tax=Pantoea sp. TaxID=69393 RepID=UPI0039E5FAAC
MITAMSVKKNVLCSLVSLCLLAPFPGTASDTATLKLKVTIVDNTCSVEADSGNVFLGNISAKDMRGAGTQSRPVGFTVLLKNCGSAVSGVNIYATGSQDAANKNALAVSGGDAGGAVASGVAIYLRDAEDKLVPLNSDQSTRYALTPGT